MHAKNIFLSSAVKNQYFHECVARVYLLIFSPHVIYLVFSEKKSKTISGRFPSDLEVSVCL